MTLPSVSLHPHNTAFQITAAALFWGRLKQQRMNSTNWFPLALLLGDQMADLAHFSLSLEHCIIGSSFRIFPS